jgi:hypothetical protein
MANETKLTPKDYDRWGKTCVKFNDTPKKATPKKVVKTAKKGK